MKKVLKSPEPSELKNYKERSDQKMQSSSRFKMLKAIVKPMMRFVQLY
jgi:hypothetical protein